MLYEFVYDDWGTDNPVQACKTHNALDEQLTVTTINDSSICKSEVRSCSCILSVVIVAYSSQPQERLPELMTTVQRLQPSTLVKLSGQTPCLIYHNALESSMRYRLCRLWRGNQLRVRLNAVTVIRTLSDKSESMRLTGAVMSIRPVINKNMAKCRSGCALNDGLHTGVLNSLQQKCADTGTLVCCCALAKCLGVLACPLLDQCCAQHIQEAGDWTRAPLSIDAKQG